MNLLKLILDKKSFSVKAWPHIWQSFGNMFSICTKWMFVIISLNAAILHRNLSFPNFVCHLNLMVELIVFTFATVCKCHHYTCIIDQFLLFTYFILFTRIYTKAWHIDYRCMQKEKKTFISKIFSLAHQNINLHKNKIIFYIL